MISTRTHGIVDYLTGLLLIGAPAILGFAAGPERTVMIVLGVMALVYSLMTNYELGAVKVIPMSMHLTLDFLSGLFLAASPWLLGFADRVATPHVVLGLCEIGAAMLTRRSISAARATV